ncbi:MAG: O-antigen ligase family protein [Actinomycetota bacterium]|nr:O-antigen ligase family protein [Actinomycetota bacterium]
MTTYKRTLPDIVVAGSIATIAILLGVLGVKNPLLAVGGFGIATMVAVATIDATLPTIAWLAVAPFVQALEPTSPLIILTLAFHRFLLPVAGLSALLGQSVRRRLRLFASEKWLLAFLAFAVVSLVMTWRGGAGGEGAATAQRTFLLAYVVPFGALLLAYRIPESSRRRLLITLAIVAGVTSVGGVAQVVTGAAIFPGAAVWQEIWAPRAVGTMGNPAVTGYVTHVGLFAAVYLAVRQPGWRLVAVPTMIVGVVFTMLTYTRSAWVALALGIITVAWLYPKARPWVVGSIMVVVVAFAVNVGGFVDSAFLEERAGNQENVEGRVAFGSTGIRMFKDSPVVGQGFGTYDVRTRDFAVGFGRIGASVAVADTSHNTFLTILGELGAVGFLLYVAAICSGLRRGVSALRGRIPAVDRLMIATLMAGAASYIVSANLIDMRFFSFAVSLFWFNVGLIDASARHAVEGPRAGAGEPRR